ncbi:MAG: hypothetical protein WAX69_04920 [Victivallales bacterium]
MQEAHRRINPKWSPLLTFYVFLFLVIAVSLFIFLFMKKSILIELETITGLVSFLIFLFLSIVLYHGVGFNRNEKITITWFSPNLNGFDSAYNVIDTGGMFSMAGAESGISGFLAGLLLDIIVSFFLAIALALLLWIGINAAIATFAIIILPLFFLYEKSLRIVVAKGRTCRTDFAKTILFSLALTVIYTGWFYAILLAAHLIARMGR